MIVMLLLFAFTGRMFDLCTSCQCHGLVMVVVIGSWIAFTIRCSACILVMDFMCAMKVMPPDNANGQKYGIVIVMPSLFANTVYLSCRATPRVESLPRSGSTPQASVGAPSRALPLKIAIFNACLSKSVRAPSRAPSKRFTQK